MQYTIDNQSRAAYHEYEKMMREIEEIERQYPHPEVILCPHMDETRYATKICLCDYPKRRMRVKEILGIDGNTCFAGQPCPVRALGLR